MIFDISGIELIPGNNGNDCPGNGENPDSKGEYNICCDECNYLICCLDNDWAIKCESCDISECPRAKSRKE